MASLIKVFSRYVIARAIALGDSLDYSRLDGLFADYASAINTLVDRVNGVTNADGTLKNVPSAVAMGLAGAYRVAATASQTDFTTTITYDSSMASTNVFVFSGGTRIDSSSVAVSNSGGFLKVVIPAQTAGVIVIVNPYTVGAGISNDLASTASGKGASLVGIQDSASIYTASTVETALAEAMTALNSLITSIGSLATYIRRDGSVVFTANQPMGGFKLTGLAAGTTNGDSIRYEQLQAYVNSLNAISATFLPLAGGTMTGDIAMGGHRITGGVTPVDNAEFVIKSYVDAALNAATATLIAPPGSITMYGGVSIPSGWLEANGQAVSRTTYAVLYAIYGVTYGPGDASTTFNLPNLASRSPIGVGTGTDNQVTSVTLTAGGAGYTNTGPSISYPGPTVTFSGGGASIQATARAVVTGGVVTAIVLLTRGSGYTSVPTIAIGGPGAGATATASLTLSVRALADKVGEEAHIQIEAELAMHDHTGSANSGGSGIGSGGSGNFANTARTGSNTPMNVIQPSLALRFIVKT